MNKILVIIAFVFIVSSCSYESTEIEPETTIPAINQDIQYTPIIEPDSNVFVPTEQPEPEVYISPNDPNGYREPEPEPVSGYWGGYYPVYVPPAVYPIWQGSGIVTVK